MVTPRKVPEGSDRLVKPSMLTSNDLSCWYFRSYNFMSRYRHRNIWYDYNFDFDLENPCGYQWSRFQVTDDYNKMYVGTRQYLCLYCQECRFYELAGSESLLLHMQFAHPQEIPEFVNIIMDELGLIPKREPDFHGAVEPPADPRYLNAKWTNLDYFQDGFKNRLMFCLTSKGEDLEKPMSSVDHRDVMPWFSRDIEDFAKFQHRNVKYELNELFDPKDPKFFQILRVMVDKSQRPLTYTKQVMCMYCREPRFFDMFGATQDFLCHLIIYHFPVKIPDWHTILNAYFSPPPAGEHERSMFKHPWSDLPVAQRKQKEATLRAAFAAWQSLRLG